MMTTIAIGEKKDMQPHVQHRGHGNNRHAYPMLRWLNVVEATGLMSRRQVVTEKTYLDDLLLEVPTVLPNGVEVRVSYGIFRDSSDEEKLVEAYRVDILRGAATFFRFRDGRAIESRSCSFCRKSDVRGDGKVTGWYPTIGEPKFKLGAAVRLEDWPRLDRSARLQLLSTSWAESASIEDLARFQAQAVS